MTADLSTAWRTYVAALAVARPVQPGTPVPVAWCTVHEGATPDDEIRHDSHGYAWCGREADDEADRRCHMVALVTGDDL